jgi:hypothetical protein
MILLILFSFTACSASGKTQKTQEQITISLDKNNYKNWISLNIYPTNIGVDYLYTLNDRRYYNVFASMLITTVGIENVDYSNVCISYEIKNQSTLGTNWIVSTNPLIDLITVSAKLAQNGSSTSGFMLIMEDTALIDTPCRHESIVDNKPHILNQVYLQSITGEVSYYK